MHTTCNTVAYCFQGSTVLNMPISSSLCTASYFTQSILENNVNDCFFRKKSIESPLLHFMALTMSTAPLISDGVITPVSA